LALPRLLKGISLAWKVAIHTARPELAIGKELAQNADLKLEARSFVVIVHRHEAKE
jgi:ribosomal protein S3